MDWARILAYVTGMVDRVSLLKNLSSLRIALPTKVG
jgi:hypothetical protein